MMIAMIADNIVLREIIHQVHLELSFCSFHFSLVSGWCTLLSLCVQQL